MSPVGVSLSDICNESENHLKKSNFQSLMHLQSSRRDDNGFEIKKPCCSPAAYRPLDILHLDQVGLDVDGVVVAVDADVDNDAFWPLDILHLDQVGRDIDDVVVEVAVVVDVDVDNDAFWPLDILYLD